MADLTYLLFTDIHADSAADFVDWIQSLEPLETTTPMVYINSPGGSLSAAQSMIDAMVSSKHQIITIGTGMIASSALLLFIHGQGRVLYDDTIIMSHQFSTETGFTKYHELVESQKFFDIVHKKIVKMFKKCARKKLSKAKLEKELLGPSDRYLTAEEMVGLGLAEEIFDNYGKQ